MITGTCRVDRLCIALVTTGARPPTTRRLIGPSSRCGEPTPPPVKDAAWPHTAVDRFILAQLEEKGLTPSPPADRRTLIRRRDLRPDRPAADARRKSPPSRPTPRRDAFDTPGRPAAGVAALRRALGPPLARRGPLRRHQGLRLLRGGRFPWAYTYRDYVIRAFNDDLPYDRFILEQLAADQLPLGKDQRPLAALGFLTLGGRFMNNAARHHRRPHRRGEPRPAGLTVGCARCHDHKFDPIPTQRLLLALRRLRQFAEPAVPPLFADRRRTPRSTRASTRNCRCARRS